MPNNLYCGFIFQNRHFSVLRLTEVKIKVKGNCIFLHPAWRHIQYNPVGEFVLPGLRGHSQTSVGYTVWVRLIQFYQDFSPPVLSSFFVVSFAAYVIWCPIACRVLKSLSTELLYSIQGGDKLSWFILSKWLNCWPYKTINVTKSVHRITRQKHTIKAANALIRITRVRNYLQNPSKDPVKWDGVDKNLTTTLTLQNICHKRHKLTLFKEMTCF